MSRKRGITTAAKRGDKKLSKRPPPAVNVGSAEGYLKPIEGLPVPDQDALTKFIREVQDDWASAQPITGGLISQRCPHCGKDVGAG